MNRNTKFEKKRLAKSNSPKVQFIIGWGNSFEGVWKLQEISKNFISFWRYCGDRMPKFYGHNSACISSIFMNECDKFFVCHVCHWLVFIWRSVDAPSNILVEDLLFDQITPEITNFYQVIYWVVYDDGVPNFITKTDATNIGTFRLSA